MSCHADMHMILLHDSKQELSEKTGSVDLSWSMCIVAGIQLFASPPSLPLPPQPCQKYYLDLLKIWLHN